ncbi:MAG TPA: recombinase family protein [Phycisphaerae bacterium]|nr:recombinase family protein [Phycisphaerae bacterium]
MYLNKPLKPRVGQLLVLAILARISGCENQKEASLDDQADHGKQEIAHHYSGPVQTIVIKTKAKGERIDRPELSEVRDLIRSGKIDVLFVEDLGRMIRGAAAMEILYLAYDRGVRALSPNDAVDTFEDGWEERALAACVEHLSANAQTSRRIKHKTMNRFKREGKVSRRPIAGYVVPEGVKTYSEWKKTDDLTPVIEDAFKYMLAKKNWTALAEWFNEQGFPVGPYATNEKYTGASARRFMSNPILKGMPYRGFMHTIKIGSSGARKSVKNPEGPTFYEAPHLAHVTPALFDELQAAMHEENKSKGAPPKEHPLKNVSRKRSRFPGRCAKCWYCGHEFVWGGNGISGNLMCNGARQRRCWCSVGFSAAIATAAILRALKEEYFALEGITDQFSALIAKAAGSIQSADDSMATKLDADIKALGKEKQNILAAIREAGPHEMLTNDLERIKKQEAQLARDHQKLEHARATAPKLPSSPGDLKAEFDTAFESLATDSYDFADAVRNLVSEFQVFLVRLCDGGPPVARARVVLALDRIVPDLARMPEMAGLLRRELIVDLFEPPQCVRIREQVVKLRSEGKTEYQIMELLGEKPTKTAVQKAMALHRKMERQQLADPYVLLTEAPEDYSKLRRHKHQLYKFAPVDGYQRPPLL